MKQRKNKDKVIPKLRAFFPLICILLCGLVLRLVFFTGMVRGDDFNYAHAAYELANGITHFDFWQNGTSRIGLYGPVALLYRLLGPTDATTLFFPFVCSLLSIVIIYGIGKILDGEKAGLLSALLWACLPLDIFLASDLLADGPVATFSAAAMYFVLRAERADGRSRKILVTASGLFILWAILVKPIAIITLLFIVIYVGSWSWLGLRSSAVARRGLQWIRSHYRLTIGIVISIVSILVMGYSSIQQRPLILSLSRGATDLSRVLLTGGTDIDFSVQRLDQIPLFALLGPLFLVSATVMLLERSTAARLPLIWGGFYFLYYEWGTIGANPFSFRPILFTEERSLLFILVPFVIIAGIYLGNQLSKEKAERAIIGSAGLVIAASLIFARTLLTNPDTIGFVLLEIVTVILVLVSPVVFHRSKASVREFTAGLLICFVSLSLLRPAPPYNAGFWRPRLQNLQDLRQAAIFLQSTHGPVFVVNSSSAIQLNYASNFTLGFDWAEVGRENSEERIEIGLPENPVSESYFVGTDVAPEGWDEVYQVGQQSMLITVYQAGGD